VEQPSDYSAALLGVPPLGGLSVRCRVYLAVHLRDGRHLRPTEAGVPFAFDWIYPNEAGFKALRARLARLLRSPQNKAHHAYLLGAYLRILQLARAATADELVTALTRWRQQFEGGRRSPPVWRSTSPTTRPWPRITGSAYRTAIRWS
jgi:hypothetical protein